MRDIATAALDAVRERVVAAMLLVQMELVDGTVYLSSGPTLDHDGQQWLGASRIGSVSAIDDSVSERQALRFTLSSVPVEMLALSMDDRARGKRVTIREAILDTDTMAVLASPAVWTGSLNQVSIQEGGGSGSVSATAEHRGTTYARAKPLRYTDGDQQRLHPGDRSLQFVVSQANHPDVWPAAAFFRE